MKRISIFFLLLVIALKSIGQLVSSDKALILNHRGQKEVFQERKVRYGFGKDKLLANIFLAPFMFAYQKTLAPQISASCLYHPSCSEFSKELFQNFGILKAFLSTTDRLMRCDRISATDIRHQQVDPSSGKKNESSDYYRFRCPHCSDEGH